MEVNWLALTREAEVRVPWGHLECKDRGHVCLSTVPGPGAPLGATSGDSRTQQGTELSLEELPCLSEP